MAQIPSYCLSIRWMSILLLYWVILVPSLILFLSTISSYFQCSNLKSILLLISLTIRSHYFSGCFFFLLISIILILFYATSNLFISLNILLESYAVSFTTNVYITFINLHPITIIDCNFFNGLTFLVV